MSEKVFDYKKEFKDLYMPKDKPGLIEVPPMNFIMVDGIGDAENNPKFVHAVDLLFGLSYAIKMSKKNGKQPIGYFDYVVPPLEGLWWIDEGEFSLIKRDNWKWTMMIRQPEFVNEEVFKWACGELARKRPELDIKKARFEAFCEGLCVQMMHIGPYSTEPETMKKIHAYFLYEGLRASPDEGGKHHEIYLSDPRKTKPESLKTVIRCPVVRT